MTEVFDIAVIGAGLIGASTAYHLAGHCSVVLLEQESSAGYHSSGRSAAVLLPTYGGRIARALTAASTDFLARPPGDFVTTPLLASRGCLVIADESQTDLLEHWVPESRTNGKTVRRLSGSQAAQTVPILRVERISAALLMDNVKDIDSASLLQGYLRHARAQHCSLRLANQVVSLTHDGESWTVCTPSAELHAKVVVNAAGAWADDIAAMAGASRRGLVPTRRTLALVMPASDIDVRAWPLVADAGERFYFKPDGHRICISPADRSPVAPQDIQPDEWDVAVAVERLESATTLDVRRVEHSWAGLRTFALDDEPVIGFDPDVPDFLWAAAFGGYGVQASHAAGQCCASLILANQLPEHLTGMGIQPRQLSPDRLPPITKGPQL